MSEPPPITSVADLQALIQRPPYHEFLAVEAVAVDAKAGAVTILLPFRADFARRHDAPEIHGGITAALIDLAGVYAVAVACGVRAVPTIQLSINYLRMARATDLTAHARAIKLGRTIAVADIEVCDAGERLIAVGRGAFSTAGAR